MSDDSVEFPVPMKDIKAGEEESELEPGSYKVIVSGIGRRRTSDKGTPYHKVFFQAAAGIHGEYFYITEPAMWRWRQLFFACGYNPNTIPQHISRPMLEAGLVGRELEIELAMDGSYLKVSRCRRIGSVQSEPWPGPGDVEPRPNPVSDHVNDTGEYSPPDNDDLPF